jgi:hypothetical protein
MYEQIARMVSYRHLRQCGLQPEVGEDILRICKIETKYRAFKKELLKGYKLSIVQHLEQ